MFSKKILIKTIGVHTIKAFVALLLAAAVISFLAWQINRISASLSDKKKISFVLEKRNETIVRLKEDFARLENPEERILSAFVPSDNILPFVGTLESVASESGLAQQFQFGSPAVFSGDAISISRIDFSINVNGNINTFINYITRLEALDYFAGIISINITAPAEGWERNSTASLRGVLYAKE